MSHKDAGGECVNDVTQHSYNTHQLARMCNLGSVNLEIFLTACSFCEK